MDAYPISRPPYRLDLRKLQVMNEEIKKLLEIGVIRPSKKPWASPALLVGKKDGGEHLCIDYSRLNAVTKLDLFHLPRIVELIDKLGLATHISTLDLERGYHQLIVHNDSVCKTAFITQHGKWEYVRMPFGPKNASSVFQRLINSMLADTARFSAAYKEDIVVFSKTFEEHIVHLEAVFSRLEETGLVLNPTKCKLAKPTCQYLGHRVGAGEVRPLQAKIDDLTSYPKPGGLYNFSRNLIFFCPCHNFFPLSSVQIIIIPACCLLCVL